jgi:hypothetical protein
MKNKLLVVTALALASLSMASAKSYSFILSAPAKAGELQLAPGEYKVEVDGANAVFTEQKSGKHLTTPVKVESGDKKHDMTAIETTKTADGEKVKAIELGGSNETLQFGGE